MTAVAVSLGHSGLFKAQFRIRLLNGKVLYKIRKSIIAHCRNGYRTGIRTGIYVITVSNGVVRIRSQRFTIDGYGNIRRNLFAGISCVTVQFHSRFGNNAVNLKRPFFVRQVSCCVKIRAVRHTDFNLVVTRINGLHFCLALIVFHRNIAHTGDVRCCLDVCSLCRAVICQAARCGKDKILRCGSCLLNLISHTGCLTTHCDACGIGTGIGGGAGKFFTIRILVADSDLIHRRAQPVADRSHLCFFRIAVVGRHTRIRSLDDHTAAVASVRTTSCFTGSGDGLAVCTRYVCQAVLMHAEIQVALAIRGNKIFIRHIRGKDLVVFLILVSCTGCNYIYFTLIKFSNRFAHANLGFLRQSCSNGDSCNLLIDSSQIDITCLAIRIIRILLIYPRIIFHTVLPVVCNIHLSGHNKVSS